MVGPAQLPVLDGARHDAGGGDRRRADRVLRGHCRYGPERHQAGPGLFDRQPARLHVHRGGRRRLRRRRLPSDDPRLLQGLPLSWLRLGDSRDGRRAGHAQDGRVAQTHAGDVLDLPGRDARDLRLSTVCGLHVQGRNPAPGLRSRPSFYLGADLRGRGADRLLHVPPGLHDVFRRVPRHPRAGASPARIAAFDVRSAGRAGRAVGGWRVRDAARLRRATSSRSSAFWNRSSAPSLPGT